MKKIALICITSVSFLLAHAQNENFYKHELKAALGSTSFWLYEELLKYDERIYYNISVSYLYRPMKWFWMGTNVVNHFGNILRYTWREYDTNGTYRDVENLKMKYAFTFAPEIRFSYLNIKAALLYSSFSCGWIWHNGFDDATQQYPQQRKYVHVTLFGFAANFGANNNIFLGGELGNGYKGLFNFHGGYRF